MREMFESSPGGSGSVGNADHDWRVEPGAGGVNWCLRCGEDSCDGTCQDLSFEEYSRRAHALAKYPEEHGDFYCVSKLTGEAGEVSEKFGKQLRDHGARLRDPAFGKAVLKELGDVLWYVNELAIRLGYTLQDVAEGNLIKLEDRSARGVLHGSGDDR